MKSHFFALGLAAWSLAACTRESDADWQDYDGPGAMHFAAVDQIDTGNVDRLGLAWYRDITVGGDSLAAPVEAGGVLYFAAGNNAVSAIDVKSGKLLWSYDPGARAAAGELMRANWGGRGIAYAQGRVFVGTLDGRLIALDAKTGALAWSAKTTTPGDGRYITGAPWVFKDTVVIGHGGADFAPVRGYVTAYDQASGRQKWRFYTVPGNPEEGFESPAMEMAARTWTGEWWKYGGGGTVWNAMAYDPRFNRLYIGTGNGTPWNRKIRSPGGGDNLFLCSIVALDADTGEYVWHYQTNPGEAWDYNSAMDIELADLTIGGEARPVILHAPKNGFLYAIDRRTGELVSADPLVRTTWASRIDIATGKPIENPAARYPAGAAAVVYPAMFGAHNIEAMSFSPKSGLVYIPTIDAGGIFVDPPEAPENWKFRPGMQISNGLGDPPPGLAPEPPKAALVAWDPVAHKEVWRVKSVPIRGGGATVATAGGLVFQGSADGTFNAYDDRTGKRLWSFPAGVAVTAQPISYTVGGKQYVSVVAGARSQGPMGLPREWSYGQGFRLLTFALDGTATLPPAHEQTRPIALDRTMVLDPAKVAAGQRSFALRCSSCHGPNALSGGAAPDLLRSTVPLDRAAFAALLMDGPLVDRGMPRFADMGDPERESIRVFLQSQARKIAAASPARPGTPVGPVAGVPEVRQ